MTVETASATLQSHQEPRESDAAHALFAATAQIGLALRESQDPVAELGGLLAHLVETLKALRSAPFDPGADPVPARAVRGLLEQVQSDVFQGIQQLQFYDRMVQHLSHLQDYLIAVANELDSGKQREQAREMWDGLHDKLRKRLISEEQRGLLDLFLSPQTAGEAAPQGPPTDHAAPGSSELF
jgi:hypothetical protein